jgi:ribosomal protein L2
VLRLRDIPVGQPLHNLEYAPGAGGKAARAAHTSALITVKHEHHAVVKVGGRLLPAACDCDCDTLCCAVPCPRAGSRWWYYD